jgi:hypothetical protein
MVAFSGVAEYAVGESPRVPFAMSAEAGHFVLSGGAVASNFEQLSGPTEGGVAELAVAETTRVSLNSYSMPAAAGIFSLAGQSIGLGLRATLEAGSFVLAGQPVGMSQPVGCGTFILNGQPIGVASSLVAAYGSFSLSGGVASLAQTVDAGVFNLTGGAASARPGVSAEAGLFNMVGRPISQAFGYKYGPSEGGVAEYAVGEFPRPISYSMVCDAGTFITSGAALFGLRETAETGTFSLNGGAAGFAWPVAAGLFEFNGQPIGLQPSVAADVGSFSLSGGLAGITWPVQAGYFEVHGQPSLGTTSIRAGRGSFELVGYPVANLVNETGYFSFNGFPIVGRSSIQAACGYFATAFQDARFPVTYTFRGEAGLFSLNGQSAGGASNFRAAAGLFTLTGIGTALRPYMPAGAGSFTLSGYPVGYVRGIIAAVGRFTVVGWPVASITGPTGDFIYLVEIQAHDGTGVQNIYLGSDDWRSGVIDTPSNQWYESRVRDPGNFERHLFSQGATRGKSTVGAGDIVILSGDPGNGALIDDWLTYGFDGRPITIKALPVGADSLAAATTLFRGRLEDIDSTNPMESFSLKVADRLADLNKPLLTERYAGTTLSTGATAEGNADLKAQIKQQVWGRAGNVLLQPVNVYDLIYKATRVGSFTSVQSITVYDGGLALTNDGDSASLAALQAASISLGHYRTCFATGDVRLGAQPVLAVTADIVEGATAADRTAAQIAYRMMRQYGISANELVIGSFTALDTKNAAECQIVVADESSCIDVVQTMLDSIGGSLVPGRAEAFEVNRFEAPVAAPALLFNIEEQGIQDTLDRVSGSIPVKRVNLQYGKIWHVQPESEINGAVDIARRNYLGNEYRSVTSYDAAIEVKHLKSPDLAIETCLVYEADAQAEATRLLNLHKVEREQYNIALTLADGWAAEPGQALTLVGPRLGLEDGKPFNIIGRVDDYVKKQVVVRVWG